MHTNNCFLNNNVPNYEACQYVKYQVFPILIRRPISCIKRCMIERTKEFVSVPADFKPIEILQKEITISETFQLT